MIDCPACGFGKNIKDGQTKCHICGTDLTLLQSVDSLPEYYYKRAMESLQKGNYDETIDRLKAAACLDDKFSEPLVALGDIYSSRNQYDDALSHYNKALNIDPNNQDIINKIKYINENKVKHLRSVKIKNNIVIGVIILAAIGIISMLIIHYLSIQNTKSPAAVISILQNRISAYSILQKEKLEIGYNEENKTYYVAGNLPSDLYREIVCNTVKNELKDSKTDFSKLKIMQDVLSTDTAVEKIKNDITVCPELKDISIDVSFKDNMIYLKGQIPSNVHKRLIIEIASSHANNITLNDTGLIANETSNKPQEKKQYLYTVKKGDSLQIIAHNIYGNSDLWKTIYQANRDIIKDPSLIYKGQILIIPFLQ